MLEIHTKTNGNGLNNIAKYFVRALARQDMLISLSRLQRVKIDATLWLDEHSLAQADRFWGYTTSLAPVLSELCALAEDVQLITDSPFVTEDVQLTIKDDAQIEPHLDLGKREVWIRAQLVAWRPTHNSSLSMQTSRKLLLHAYAWRAAGLLYLFRLFNRPGSSIDADQAALGMAYEVIVHISGPGPEIKLSLWPLFVAACELKRPDDRENATELFDNICRARPTVTAKRTE